MQVLKFNHYEDIRTEYELCKGIEDIWPYQLKLPPPPKPEEILNFGKPIHEQTLQRVVMPKEIKQLNYMPRDEAIRITDNTPEYADFIESMWYKMVFGEWQYIQGKAFHISPTYWFYLNFWNVSDKGLPSFRYDEEHYCTDLWNFSWWDYCVTPSDVCFGELSIAARRDGKSFRALCKGYRRLILGRMRQGAIQSKSESDAISCFKKKGVEPVLKLPFFFRAFESNGTYPGAEGFSWTPRSERGEQAKLKIIDPDDYLMGLFKPFNSIETACDGEKWHIHISDEDGKLPKEIDAWERWQVIKPALKENGKIIGKEICTTTVEDIERTGADKFKYKFMQSNRNPTLKGKDLKVDKFSETNSGLWPWFTPSYTNIVWNKFGKAIVNNPTKTESDYLKSIKDRDFLKGGKERVNDIIERPGLADHDKFQLMRKHARTVKDAFIGSGGYCHFDFGIISHRLKDFEFGLWPEELRGRMAFGNFEWKNVFGGEVEFVQSGEEQAHWWISYMPGPQERNQWNTHPVNGKKNPANWHKFASGADPFKFDTEDVIDKDRMSKGAMTIWANYDPTVDTSDNDPATYVTDDMCGEYLFRPATVDDLCEDYLKACIFYGMKVFPENNNPDVIRAFRTWGFENYIQYDMELKKIDGITFQKEKTAGGATNDKTTQSMFRNVQKYVKEKGMRCKFPRTLQQLLEVSPDDMSPYDLFISLSKCLAVAMDFNPIRFATMEAEGDDIGDMWGSFSPSAFSEINGEVEGAGLDEFD